MAQSLRQALTPDLDSPPEARQELGKLLGLLADLPDETIALLDTNDQPDTVLEWARDQRGKQGTGA